MIKYLLISLFLHSLFLITQPLTTLTQNEQQAEGSGSSGSDAKGQYDVQIIEQTDGEGSAKEVTNFYWGIGISTSFYLSPDFHHWVIQINQVYQGYSAYDAGLQVDDIIFLINGEPPGTINDIKGDGPARLYLTILRKNGRIEKIVDRVKVYY